MLKKQVIVFFKLYLSAIFIKNLVISEWIELPQFSDKVKIYRKSPIKFDVMKVNSLLNISKNQFSNMANQTNCDSDEIYGDIALKPSEVLLPTDSNQSNDNRRDKNLTTHMKNLDADQNFTKINKNTTSELEKETVNLSSQTFITTSPLLEFSKNTSKSNKKKQSTSYALLKYIPINQLSRVHKILVENLGKTHEEKLNFLESFKNNLVKTIRMIIPDVVHRNPARRKRGSSWDEHESHVGFPSLEGALLSISFLTFAIYLIRLIMMLMRNLNTNTAGSTILINRSKRFISQLTEETARIHDYLHEFDSRIQS